MLHKMMIGLIAVAAIAVMAMPTDVSARGSRGVARSGGHHFSGGHIGHFRGGLGFRPYYYGGYGYASCWRYFGLRRVWVCDGGYPYY